MASRRLNDVEIEAYDVIADDLARRVKVSQVPFIPGGYKGMALGRRVLLAGPQRDDGTSTLLAHELVHVRQWHELGVVGFSVRYLSSFVLNLVRYRRWNTAYHNIGAEIEAKRETTDWLRRRTSGQG